MGTTEKQGLAQAAVLETDAFASLLNKEFKPKTEQAQEAVISAVRTLAEQALANTNIISADAYRTVEGMIAEIDRKLSEQVNRIIHHEDFQRLEGSWRGLHYLVSNTETDEMLKIQILNINKRSWVAPCSATKASCGTRARSSRRSMRRSTVSLVESHSAAW